MSIKSGAFALSALLMGALLLVCTTPSPPLRSAVVPTKDVTAAALPSLSLPAYFEPATHGFVARTRGYSVHLSSQGADFALSPRSTGATVGMRLVGARRSNTVGERRMPGKKHYLRGKDPKRWRRNVPLYQQVRCPEVYPGVDLVYHLDPSKDLEYDFVVAPGADPNEIALNFTGVTGARVNDEGALVLRTSTSELQNRRPVAYQEFGGVRQVVEADYRVDGSPSKPEVRFALGDYDPTRTLVIDPILTYSTYFGGSLLDDLGSVAVAPDGTIYIAGSSDSTDLPLKSPFQTDQPSTDVMIARLDPTVAGDEALLFATVLGGGGPDFEGGMRLDPSGAVCITGDTQSTDFPTTPQAFQSNAQPSKNVFCSRLSSDGSALQYSTYLGGSADEIARGLAIDNAGNLYITGLTVSVDFPTKIAVQSDQPGSDAFVAKLNPNLSGEASLVFSTYLGGSGVDNPSAIAVSPTGVPVVTGATTSPNFPVTASAFDTTFNGQNDVFVTRLSSSGGSITYSTFLGGLEEDRPKGIALDSTARIHVAGQTQSSDFPITSTAFATSKGGVIDGFYTAIVPTAVGTSQLDYSTFVGGSSNDVFEDVQVNGAGKPFLVGLSASDDFPLNRSLQAKSGLFDVVVVRLDPAQPPQAALRYSTFLGGVEQDLPSRLFVNGSNEVFVTGSTHSVDFPTTPGAFQPQTKGSSDGFLARVSLDVPAAPADLKVITLSNTQLKLTWMDKSSNETGFLIERKTGGGSFQFLALVGANVVTHNDSGLSGGIFTYRVRAVNTEGDSAFSSEAAGTTLAPTAPSGLQAVTNGPLVVVKWTDSIGEDSYEVRRKLSAQNFFVTRGTLGRDVISFGESTDVNKTFIYQIKATNVVGETFSNQVAATTLAAPSNVTVTNPTGSTNSLRIEWIDNSLSLETGFRIQRKVAGGSFNNVLTVGANVTAAVNTGLTPDTEYFYRVLAINANGSSGISNQGSARTVRIPVAPSEVSAKALSGTQVRVRWKDNSIFEQGFRVERAEVGQAFKAVGRAGKDGEEFFDSGLAPKTDYVYRVFGFNDGGDSPSSNEADVTTLAGPVGRLAVAEKVVFPDTQVGQISARPLILRNRSQRNSLLVLIEQPFAPFGLKGKTRHRIPPGASALVTLQFAPSSVGPASGELILKSSDPDHAEVVVRLSGKGASP